MSPRELEGPVPSSGRGRPGAGPGPKPSPALTRALPAPAASTCGPVAGGPSQASGKPASGSGSGAEGPRAVAARVRRLLSSWKQDKGRSWSPRTNLGPIMERPAPQVVNMGGAWEEPPGRGAGPGAEAASNALRAGPAAQTRVCTLRSSGGSWRHTQTQPSRGPGIHRPPRLCAPHVQTSPRAGLCFDAAQGPPEGWLSPPTTGKEPSGVGVAEPGLPAPSYLL